MVVEQEDSTLESLSTSGPDHETLDVKLVDAVDRLVADNASMRQRLSLLTESLAAKGVMLL
eukprot:15998161-Heterocapsa_arctica.AAC.1